MFARQEVVHRSGGNNLNNSKHLHTSSQSRRLSTREQSNCGEGLDGSALEWGCGGQYNLVVDTFQRKKSKKKKYTYIHGTRTPPPPSKIKKNKNKCSFLSSLFCSRLHISCSVGSDDDDGGDDDTRTRRRNEARCSRRTGCELTNTSVVKLKETSFFFFFCYEREQQVSVSLRFLPNRGDHYRELSSATGRPASYDQGRVSKHISDTVVYGFRSFRLAHFPFSLDLLLPHRLWLSSSPHSMVDLFPYYLLTIRRIRLKGVSVTSPLRFSFVEPLRFSFHRKTVPNVRLVKNRNNR